MRFLSRRALLIVPVFVLALLVAGLPTAAFGNRDDNQFRARLLGVNEVPSINTVATGNVRLTLNRDNIQFQVSWANLSSTPGAAHIHIGQRHTNGAVSAFFCGGGGKPACPTATTATLSGTIVGADIVGPAAQGIPTGATDAGLAMAGLQRMIRLGATYSNVHTTNFPSGEIRGQNSNRDNDDRSKDD
jgi:CHRD domain-containing protein